MPVPQHLEVTIDNLEFKRMKTRIAEIKAKRDLLQESLSKAKEGRTKYKKRNESAIKVRAFIQKVAKETQSKLEYHISNLVTLAEAAIFPNPYDFEVAFETRRNKTECDLWFVKKGERLDPMNSTGGGPIDVASFALRCAYWSLKKTRPTLILDECFRNVSADLQTRCSEMIKNVSEKLGIQIIMISHLPRIIESADRVIEITQEKGISKAEIVGQEMKKEMKKEIKEDRNRIIRVLIPKSDQIVRRRRK